MPQNGRKIRGIALSAGEGKVTVRGLPDEPGAVAAIFAPLAAQEIDVGMIVQDVSRDNQRADVTFTVEQPKLQEAVDLIRAARDKIGFEELFSDNGVVKVTVIGRCSSRNTGMAQVMFDALGGEGINIQAISTSEVKVSVLVDGNDAERAVRALQNAYTIDNKS